MEAKYTWLSKHLWVPRSRNFRKELQEQYTAHALCGLKKNGMQVWRTTYKSNRYCFN
jgi:hypothetical protein